MFLLGGLTWAVWPSGNDKVVEPPPTAVAKSDHQVGSEQSAEPKPATPSVEQSKAKAKDADAVTSKVEVTQATQTADPKPAAEPVAVDSALKTAKPTELAPPTPQPAAVKIDKAKATDSRKVAPTQPATTNAAPKPTPKVAESVSKAPDHSPVLKFDPLDFDVDRLGSNAKAPSDPTASTSSIPNKQPVEAANGVASNDVTPASVAINQGKQPVADDATPLHTVNNGVMVRRGPPGDATPRAAGHLLATRVKSFQVTDMPLVRFIDTLSGVAGTGITLDPIALEQVGISPQATVSVNAQDAPLQAILHDALAQRRLDITEQGGQPRVVLPKAEEPHPIDYDVKDLVAGNDAAAIGQLIEHFVAPATWKSAGGKGTLQASGTTLHIEQSDAVRRQVVIFCERLRLARGLVVQSKYPAAMLSVESPYQRLSAKLSEHTTFTFLPWTRLADVVRNWQEMSGLTVLVDWGALAEAELGPSSPVACSANRPHLAGIARRRARTARTGLVGRRWRDDPDHESRRAGKDPADRVLPGAAEVAGLAGEQPGARRLAAEGAGRGGRQAGQAGAGTHGSRRAERPVDRARDADCASPSQPEPRWRHEAVGRPSRGRLHLLDDIGVFGVSGQLDF